MKILRKVGLEDVVILNSCIRLDVDNGNIKRKAIIDVDEGSQYRPSILQMPDYSIGVLWLQKNGLPYCQELKFGIYKSDDLKTSGRE